MRKYADTVLTVVLTLITTLILNFGVSYLLRSKGNIAVGKRIATQGAVLCPIDITNQRSEPLDGLLLSIPSSVRTSDIAASSPVQLVDMPENVGNAANRRVKLNGVAPNTVVRLLIPVRNAGESDHVGVVNASQVGMDVVEDDQPPNSGWGILKQVGADSLVYGVLLGIFSFAVFSRQQELRTELQKATESRETLNRELSKIEAETHTLRSEMGKTWARTKLLLLARISDYSRELEFWRDTVRRVLYANSSTREEREAFLSEVTATLKTYSTRASRYALDYNTITTMAGILNRSEEAQRRPPKPTDDRAADAESAGGD